MTKPAREARTPLAPELHTRKGLAVRLAVTTLTAIIATALLTASIDRSMAEPKPDPKRQSVREIEVTSKPINSFDRSMGSQQRFGKLTFLGGLKLSSTDKSFGGWSGLAIDPDGKNIIAVSDAGLWMTATLQSKDGQLASFDNARTGPLKALSGENLARERDRDAEAVELVSGTLKRGKLLIAFEQNHRIGRFDVGPEGVSPPRSYIRPDKSRGRMSTLKGFEAMTVLTKGNYRGSLIAIAERFHDRKGNHTGWFWTGRTANSFTITDIGGYDITAMATLPEGDLILLERRFNWLEGIKMRLRRVSLSKLKPGARIEGEVLLEATMAQDIDNMEGLAVHSDSSRNAVLTIISDDNFNRLFQRTILLQFRLDADTGGRAKKN